MCLRFGRNVLAAGSREQALNFKSGRRFAFPASKSLSDIQVSPAAPCQESAWRFIIDRGILILDNGQLPGPGNLCAKYRTKYDISYKSTAN